MRDDGGDGLAERIPTDAAALLGVLAAAAGAGLLPLAHPVRVVVTLVVLFFVPGYALTLAVFPADGTRASERRFRGLGARATERAGVDGVERLALSFGLSVFVLPLVAFAVSLVELPYQYTAVGGAVGAVSLLALAVGLLRRRRVERASRYDPSLDAVFVLVSRMTRGHGLDVALNAVLAVAVVAALAGLGLGLAAPPEGDGFTEVSLLTEDLDGELSAANYPTELTRNETAELVLSVTNQERERVAYDVVVQLQNVDADGTVTDRSTLAFLENDVAPGDTWRARHDLQLFRAGENQRVVYLLYRGEQAADPTIANADRHVYFWTDVTAVGAGQGEGA